MTTIGKYYVSGVGLPRCCLLLDLDDIASKLRTPEDIGIFSDVDGTLSEISESPDLAFVSTSMSGVLARLNKVYPLVALVSGRRAEDVQKLVDQDDLFYLGNHGLERRWGNKTESAVFLDDVLASITRVKLKLLKEMPGAPGIYVEDKKLVLAIHYRQCHDRRAVREAQVLAERLASENGLMTQTGRRITEVRPVEADKGRAILALAGEKNIKQIIYLGDDATDLDAFKALRRAAEAGTVSSLCVAVLGDESPSGLAENADYQVTSVDEVQRFLEWLAKRGEDRRKG